jgi:glycosyltransferase involved in cell wall biosynthesis
MTKILYISYDGLTDPLGQSQVLPYVCGLSKEGYQFVILSFEKKDRYKREGPAVKKIVDANGVHWVPLWFTSKPPVVSKIFDRWKLKRAVLKLWKQKKFDLVHCRSYVAAEAGLFLKRKFKAKFLFDMRGFWADEKVDNGQWDQKKYLFRSLYKRYKKKEKEFLLAADGIITLTQAARNYLLSIPEYKTLFIEVIPCCVDLDLFDFHKISREQIHLLKDDLKVTGTAKVITYLGSAGGWYMTKEMFRFFKMLSDKYPEYVMLFLTKDDPAIIKEEAGQAGISRDKIIIAYSQRDRLPQFLALSTCGIFFIRNTFSKIASSPTKHGELLAMGIPVICNDIGDTGSIVESTQTGIVINDFSEQSFQNAICKLTELEKITKENIRNCAKKIFDLDAGIQKYLEVYHYVLA